MDTKNIILTSIYAVGSLVVVVMAGFGLAKMSVLTPTSRRILSECNFYMVGPIFAFVEVMAVVDKDKLNEIGYIVFSSIGNIVVGFIVTLAFAFILRFDIRLLFSFTFICVYANIVIFPQMLSAASCTTGVNVKNKNCAKSASYSSVPLIYITCLYWITIYPALKYERIIRLKVKRAFAIALNFYPTIDNFLNDSQLTNYAIPSFDERITETAPQSNSSPSAREPIRNKPIEVTDPNFLKEECDRVISFTSYNKILSCAQEFEEKVLSKPECQRAKDEIFQKVLKPNDILIIPENVKIFSWAFIKQRVIGSPPAFFAILGLIGGFIFPFKTWLFGNDDPLPLLIKTLRSIGSMYSVISMILLGTTIAQGAVMTKDMIMGWKHIIFSNIIRNIILPLLGLLWVFVILKNMDENMFKTNGVLMLIDYIYWIAPNGIGLVTVYIVADYPAKEFGVMSVYMNLICLPMMTIHLIIYISIYQNYKA